MSEVPLPAQQWIGYDPERGSMFSYTREDVIAYGDARVAELRAALQKLVDAKDMKDRLRRLHEMGHGTDYTDYFRLKAEAWAAARAALAAK